MRDGNLYARAFHDYYTGRYPSDLTPTATPAQQAAIKEAFANGATIEAKGKSNLCEGYEWAATPEPKFDFNNNYYRVQTAQPG